MKHAFHVVIAVLTGHLLSHVSWHGFEALLHALRLPSPQIAFTVMSTYVPAPVVMGLIIGLLVALGLVEERLGH